MRTVRAIARELCKREGKKRQVDVAQMMEVLGHLADMTHENNSTNGPVDENPMMIISISGFDRANRKKRKK